MKKDPLEDIIEEVNESDETSESLREPTTEYSNKKSAKEISEKDSHDTKDERKDTGDVQAKSSSYENIGQVGDRCKPSSSKQENVTHCRTEICSFRPPTEVYTIRDAYWERRNNDIFLDNYNTLRRNKNMARQGDRCDSTKVITTMASVVFIVIFVIFLRRGEFH